MLRAAVKHGISKALSAHRGFEVWDFEIQESDGGVAGLEIRYRYHRDFVFTATIGPRESGLELHMKVDVIPGDLGHRETFGIRSLDELYAAIELWTTRLGDELRARSENRVLAVQQKAINYLEKHLPDLPDKPMGPRRLREYHVRLDRLEAAVIEIRAGSGEDREQRVAEIRDEFESLRHGVEVLGEKSFFHAVLVRLVKYFWDEDNLRLVEAGSKAAQQFLGAAPARPQPSLQRAARMKSAPPPAPAARPRPQAAPPPTAPNIRRATEFDPASAFDPVDAFETDDEEEGVEVESLDLETIRERLRAGPPIIDWQP